MHRSPGAVPVHPPDAKIMVGAVAPDLARSDPVPIVVVPGFRVPDARVEAGGVALLDPVEKIKLARSCPACAASKPPASPPHVSPASVDEFSP